MPRPVLILIALLILALVVLFGLAALDREVPQAHVERSLANAAGSASPSNAAQK
jgi:hypothetical protein